MSRGYSRIIIVGNLGQDPEMRYTPNGTAVTNFSVAVNRRRPMGDGQYQDEVDWYRVSAFARLAEIADQYLAKGLKVLVDGQPQIQNFVDRNGVERTSVEIRADNFQMLNTREEADQIRASAGMSAPAGQSQGSGAGTYGGQQQQQEQQGSDSYDDFDDEDLDDVPF